MMKKILIVLVLLIPFLAFAQDAGKKKAYLFYLDSCPHCHNVDKYFQENGIYEKYEITKLDAANPFNANLLNKFYELTGDPNAGGVPAAAFGDKFLVGDKPIIDNFERDIEADESAHELPNPGNSDPGTAVSGDQSGQGGQMEDPTNASLESSQSQQGNKKYLFPVIIFALVIIGAGALIYVNRKK